MGTPAPLTQVPAVGWQGRSTPAQFVGPFNQLFHSDYHTGQPLWSLAEQTSVGQQADGDTAQLTEAAESPRLSAIAPGKKRILPRGCRGE